MVSEKRMTFFLSDSNFRELRLQTGYFQVSNLVSENTADPGPESPSALVREAVDFWLDHFRNDADRTRSMKEWDQRIAMLRTAVKKRD